MGLQLWRFSLFHRPFHLVGGARLWALWGSHLRKYCLFCSSLSSYFGAVMLEGGHSSQTLFHWIYYLCRDGFLWCWSFSDTRSRLHDRFESYTHYSRLRSSLKKSMWERGKRGTLQLRGSVLNSRRNSQRQSVERYSFEKAYCTAIIKKRKDRQTQTYSDSSASQKRIAQSSSIRQVDAVITRQYRFD